MPQPSKAISRSAEAYERLQQDLISGALEAGTKLTLTVLQSRYGLGAIPLREALNRLSAEQFVLKHDQRGFYVPPLDASVFLEIQNARIVIESAALAETIATYTPEWEDRLVLVFHHLSKVAASTPNYLLSDAWATHHAAFHRELISGCKNKFLLTIAGQLYEQSARYRARRRQIGAGSAADQNTLIDEHREIMNAALERDTKLATARLVEHYRCSVEVVLGETVKLCSSHLGFCRQATSSAEE